MGISRFIFGREIGTSTGVHSWRARWFALDSLFLSSSNVSSPLEFYPSAIRFETYRQLKLGAAEVLQAIYLLGRVAFGADKSGIRLAIFAIPK